MSPSKTTRDSSIGALDLVAPMLAATITSSRVVAVYMCGLEKISGSHGSLYGTRIDSHLSVRLRAGARRMPRRLWTGDRVALALPYEFDTSDVWRMILKGTFGLTLLIILSLLYTLVSRQWAAAGPLALSSAMLFFVTRACAQTRVQSHRNGVGRNRRRVPRLMYLR